MGGEGHSCLHLGDYYENSFKLTIFGTDLCFTKKSQYTTPSLGLKLKAQGWTENILSARSQGVDIYIYRQKCLLAGYTNFTFGTRLSHW